MFTVHRCQEVRRKIRATNETFMLSWIFGFSQNIKWNFLSVKILRKMWSDQLMVTSRRGTITTHSDYTMLTFTNLQSYRWQTGARRSVDVVLQEPKIRVLRLLWFSWSLILVWFFSEFYFASWLRSSGASAAQCRIFSVSRIRPLCHVSLRWLRPPGRDLSHVSI